MSVETPFRSSVTVLGMTCGHCTMSVTEELGELDGVRSVEVDLESGAVTVLSDRELGRDEINAAVVEAGFSLAD
ncbi:heavy-metal-associated domain-containing protein [Pseudonocardia bannensis]|uniref:Heavy-metal-associated domain-containing protein n=1 Tax=Pseudonocardia bannensis TaxID=630973 RepID=A0A848DHJ0_9PSEU|nr:cation transporter [Pseudonocardia bannensis]NMH91964.1 heavy-metal-associated domain-containing protein [Pseudonocardia bannensis]